jgi:hypothetical protein
MMPLGLQRQRLAHWVALAQRELVETESGFEITPRWNGHGYCVTVGETNTIELDGIFEFSSPSMDAVERVLILRLGAEARIREFEPVLLPSHPGDLVRGFQVNEDPDDAAIWVMLRDGTEVARVRRGTDDYSPAVEFSHIADASPWELRDSLLDPLGLPLFAVPEPPPEPMPLPLVTRWTTHLRPEDCPGAFGGDGEYLAVGNWERLVRCRRCGALSAQPEENRRGTFTPLTPAQALERFPGVIV